MFSYTPLMILLAKNGMSKTELRESIGISTTTLAKISKNEPISFDTLEKLCVFFKCPIEDIIEHIPNPDPDNKKID